MKMFSPLWNWISGICRQKRILLILCSFGCSFILLNYSLLSSSSASSSSPPTLSSSSPTTASHQKSRDLFSNSNNIKAELTVISSGSSGQEKYEREANSNWKEWMKLHSSSHKRVMHVTPEKAEKGIDEYAYAYFNELKPSSPIPKQKGESTNDFSSSDQFTSNSNSNNKTKSGVTFVTAPIRNGNHSTPSRINRIVQYDFGNDRGNNSNKVNYGSAEDEKTDKSQSTTGATSFLEESIITGNGGSSLNNNLSGSIFSIPRSSASSSPPPPIPLHGGDGKWPLPGKVVEEPPNSSPPSSTNMALKRDRHYSNDSNKDIGNSPISESIPPSSNSNSNINNFHTSPLSPFHIPPCNTPTQLRRVQKRKKNLTVIENFIMGWKRFKCNETITYTTHGDYRYLDNLVPLVERWNGPVSLSIYAPGMDMEKTLGIISYLKMCTSSKIDEWVTFHLIYDVKFSKRPAENYNKPGDMLWLDKLYQSGKWSDCSKQPNFNKYDFTFRIENGLLYPINIARNIARAAAKTYFVLASDIELYPSINLIPNFMKMLTRLQRNEEEDRTKGANNLIKVTLTSLADSLAAKLFHSGMSTLPNKITDTDSDKNYKNETIINAKDQLEALQLNIPNQGRQRQGLSKYPNQQNRHVFVLPVFEVKKDILPCQVETKKQLLTLMKRRSAVIFHHSICPQCHTFPKYEAWKGGVPSDFMKRKILLGCVANRTLNVVNSKSNSTVMNIFHKAKRKFPYQLWEPIFIGTKDEPIYDERLSWEGLRDKMVSGYVMCALDYDFYILDNAFLVHKPGIRKVVHVVTKTVMNQDRLINYRIRSELLKKFGRHEECAL